MEEAELQCGSADRVTNEEGRAADAGAAKLMEAAEAGDADAVRALLEHPDADPAVMLRLTDSKGSSALIDQQVLMTKVVEVMCDGPQARRLLDDDQPDAVREECVSLLLLHGALFDSRSPVMVRVGRKLASWAWRFAGSN
ncbi:hypothetical protein FOA52_009875 [Chlamydomonas sp. UWO 241]|nr:hypothetical protein FOA52_009875 [Chlamydomonas sp. UWO 241]